MTLPSKTLARATALLVCALLGACRAGEPRDAQARSSAIPRGSGGINAAEHLGKPSLLLISFDGFRADYLDRYKLPNFRRVMTRGTRAAAMRPVFPSITFPNHYSLVTGLYPEHHGIVENSFFDPARNAQYSFRNPSTVSDGTWYGGEPIWVTAERQGMVSACFFWPGSEADIKGIRPTYWNRYDGGVPNEDRIETVLGWLRLPADRRPHVVMLYFSDVDSVSHREKIGGKGIEKSVHDVDALLGRLLDGIEALPDGGRVLMLLTSDHGIANTSAARTVQLSSLIDTAGIRPGFSGAVTALHVSAEAGVPAAVRDRLNASLKHGRAYLREEVPERHHFRRSPRGGDVVVIMEEGWTLATSIINRSLIQREWGEHGWDPDLPSMKALFVIAGPRIPAGLTIPEVENIDVYPLMTELLGLQPADRLDGRPDKIRAALTLAK